ncbi:exodeoxyribonuclease VII large subunit [Seminibacterium arietis]|uniref:Exodeoxyribonuclease 7 large subunit n=1 Tax=Seminibacterium arietis TaxID=1173502 RepID=A0ABW3I8N4_9PAST
MQDNEIYSVSRLNQSVRGLLEREWKLIWLTGEISNFSQPVSGHWYLTLKDENAQIRCAMFRMKNSRVTFHPQNGMQVLVRGAVSLYEPRGDYQLIIDSMHPAGEGLLQQQFEALKIKLSSEGLFAQNLKKKLPHFCKTIGVVTSATGAALQDILHILKRRDPSLKVIIYPTAVQGKDAAAEIVQAIEIANRRNEVDVLIVGRGGGSLEDLWCFNEEIVARAIFCSNIPIISAVGHETDVTIADFVADLRAATPSAAAELVSRDQQELLNRILDRKQRLEIAFDRFFVLKKQQLQHLLERLKNQHPQTKLMIQKYNLQQLTHRLQQAMRYQRDKKYHKFAVLYKRLNINLLLYRIHQQQLYVSKLRVRLDSAVNKTFTAKQHQLVTTCSKLDSLSPLKVLSRGYSLVQTEKGNAITSVSQVVSGEKIYLRFVDGIVISQVEEIKVDQ